MFFWSFYSSHMHFGGSTDFTWVLWQRIVYGKIRGTTPILFGMWINQKAPSQSSISNNVDKVNSAQNYTNLKITTKSLQFTMILKKNLDLFKFSALNFIIQSQINRHNKSTACTQYKHKIQEATSWLIRYIISSRLTHLLLYQDISNTLINNKM